MLDVNLCARVVSRTVCRLVAWERQFPFHIEFDYRCEQGQIQIDPMRVFHDIGIHNWGNRGMCQCASPRTIEVRTDVWLSLGCDCMTTFNTQN